MTRRQVLGCVLTLAGGATSSQAQTSPATGDVLTRLLGSWSGAGTILGQPSTISMQWTRVLDGRFIRLTHESRIGAAARSTAFEGHAYYQPHPGGGYRATWFDSSGQTRPIVAVTVGQSLVASWGSPATEEGETTYTLDGDRGLNVVDRVKGKDGAWREFGRTRLSRTLPPE